MPQLKILPRLSIILKHNLADEAGLRWSDLWHCSDIFCTLPGARTLAYLLFLLIASGSFFSPPGPFFLQTSKSQPLQPSECLVRHSSVSVMSTAPHPSPHLRPPPHPWCTASWRFTQHNLKLPYLLICLSIFLLPPPLEHELHDTRHFILFTVISPHLNNSEGTIVGCKVDTSDTGGYMNEGCHLIALAHEASLQR